MIKPRLGFFDLSMLIISMVIGIGIFRTPQIVAQKSGTIELFFAAWIIGAVISVFGALTFAEIGARYPIAGGFYKVFSFCYHPAFAFMLNWSLVIINASSAASVALIGAEYLSPLLFPSPVSHMNIQFLVVGIVLLLYGVNMLGIRSGAGVQNVLSGLKIVLILFFSSAIFFAVQLSAPEINLSSSLETSSSTNLFFAFGAGLISVFFTYGGYQNTINFGEDIKEPQRNIPRAIFLSMAIILILYISINISYVLVLGFENVKSSPLVAAALAKQMMGKTGAAFTSVAIFISVLGFLNSALMYNPRIWYAMADDKILPKIFGQINAKRQVQEFSLTLFTILILIMFFTLGTFEKLLSYVMFTDTISLATAAYCIFILRNKQKTNYTGFKVRSSIIPIVFIITICFVTMSVISDDPLRSLYGLLVFAFGFVLYKLFSFLLKVKETGN
ncbi:amino acid transporter [Bacteroidota bacterium]|nr:amino acid transporter [Bacteroidota bacterium]